MSLLFAAQLQSFSQCAETSVNKILLVGDSWAFYMNVDGTINNAMRKWGHSGYKYITNSTIAFNGAETKDLLQPNRLAEIATQLTNNPSVEYVHLSIGGNDVMGDWKVSFTEEQTIELRDTVRNRIHRLMTYIKDVRPGIKILWSGYTYPNFSEVLTTTPLGTNHPFYGTWQKMEFPDIATINAQLNMFSALVDSMAATDPQVSFVNATGLLQYTYGQTSPLGIAPGGTYPAFSVPLPLGDPNYPSPKGSMRNYLLTIDCFHLSSKGYADLIEYHIQKYYHKMMMDNFYALAENNTQTGTVTSQGNVESNLLLGEDAGEVFAPVLTFNTTGMMDTTLAKASLFLRRESLTGTNPIGSNLQVKIKNGNFGATADIEAADYADAGDATGVPCLFGSNGGNDHWIRLDLPVSVLPFITNANPTQIQIAANGFTGGKVKFYNAADPEFAPVLNLKYGTPEEPSSINNLSALGNLTIYPNPAYNLLYIQSNDTEIEKVQIVDLMGAVVLQQTGNVGSMDIRMLSTGTYLLHMQTTNGNMVKRFVKD